MESARCFTWYLIYLWRTYPGRHDDVIKWKHFPRNWPFVRGIHRSPVNSPHKGQWLGALMFSLICVWINDWVNNREAGDLRRYRAHYDVIVMPRLIYAPSHWYKVARNIYNLIGHTSLSRFPLLMHVIILVINGFIYIRLILQKRYQCIIWGCVCFIFFYKDSLKTFYMTCPH